MFKKSIKNVHIQKFFFQSLKGIRDVQPIGKAFEESIARYPFKKLKS
jgi:hypothetical protein